MRKIVVFFLMIVWIFNSNVIAQTNPIPDDFCISADEYKLYQLINSYRKDLLLPEIQLSQALCYVANLHVQDLSATFNSADECSMHSWSDQGEWTAICYPSEQSKKNNVWLKPKEIVGYPAEAYELTYWSNSEKSADDIYKFWRLNKPSSSMLINTGRWANSSWKEIGVGIKDGYAVVWLGKTFGDGTSPVVCGKDKVFSNNALSKSKGSPQDLATKTTVYYITIGSYLNNKDGLEAVKTYKDMGFANTVLIKTDNKIRVAVDRFTDKKEADRALRKYAQRFKGAWVLTLAE